MGNDSVRFNYGNRWDSDGIRNLMRLWSEGISVQSIAKQLKTSSYAISKMVVRLRQNGVPLARRKKGHVSGRSNQLWSQSEVEYLVRRRKDGVTAEQIGIDLGRTTNAVNAMISNLRMKNVPVGLLGNGCRKLWDSNILIAEFGSIQQGHQV